MGKIILRNYQKQILKELENLASIGLFMGTGTGKTITSLFKVQNNPTDKLLIVCPYNVLEQWKSVLETNFEGFNVLEFKKSWTASQKNEEIISTKKDYNTIIVNFEILPKMYNLLNIIDNTWTIIIDESHRIKDASIRKYKYKNSRGEVFYKKEITKTTGMVLKLGELTPWKIILTATPTQGKYGGYIDFYSQLKFLGYLNCKLKDFKNKYVNIEMQKVWGISYPIPTITGYKNIKELDKILKLSCRYYDSKIGDFEPEHIEINIPKCKSYNKVKKEKVYKEIILNNSPRKRIALKTLTTGTILGKDLYGNRFIYEDNTNKIDWLIEFLKDTNEKVAIYYQYNVELKSLEKMLQKLGKKYIIINGETKNAYNEINNSDFDVMLGQFQSASQSLDGLQYKLHIMIFFSMPESSLLYKQSLGRIDRIGQEKVPMYYYLLMEKTIDYNIMEMIKEKIEFSEDTLNKLFIRE